MSAARLSGNAVAAAVAAGYLLLLPSLVRAAPIPAGPGLAPRSPQLMFYISRSMGAGAAMRPTFSFRLRQVRLGSNNGDPEGGDAFHSRELLSWQMEAHSDFRVQVGHRLTWDFTHQRLGSPSARAAIPLSLSRDARLRGGNSALEPRAMQPPRIVEAPRPSAFVAESTFRVITAADVASFNPTSLRPIQRGGHSPRTTEPRTLHESTLR
ncbi:MAG TPA: hypothetical protein VIY54_13735 [Steroidobacteraceae bacterium]